MKTKEDAAKIAGRLAEFYPEAVCTLDHGEEPYRLLVTARLSAQCTDARVNLVSEGLFEKFPTLSSFADCELTELEGAIFTCGLYRSKAKDIKAMCRILRDEYGGVVPSEMEALLRLPGVGRKIANLIRGDVFGLPAIVTDTHCIRIAKRLGLTTGDDPRRTERELEALIEPAESNMFCHRLVYFGRDICRAKSPRCEQCFLSGLCDAYPAPRT